MTDDRYYLAYENRYRAVFHAGATHWGFRPDDAWLAAALTAWVDANDLRGKHILEFACGEGACGVILTSLGCRWTGIDVAPSAIEKAKAANTSPLASALCGDCVRDSVTQIGAVPPFDAALDVMGYHMILTDAHRAAYLSHLTELLPSGAPALFLHESFRTDAYTGTVDSAAEWERITGGDYTTPELRTIDTPHGKAEVSIPLLPARARELAGYTKEFEAAGLHIERFEPNGENPHCPWSANFYTRKI